MPSQPPDDPFLARSNASLQENLDRTEPAIVASYRLLGSILLFGAIGYGLDLWLDTAHWCLLGGLIVGLVFGFVGLLPLFRHR